MRYKYDLGIYFGDEDEYQAINYLVSPATPPPPFHHTLLVYCLHTLRALSNTLHSEHGKGLVDILYDLEKLRALFVEHPLARRVGFGQRIGAARSDQSQRLSLIVMECPRASERCSGLPAYGLAPGAVVSGPPIPSGNPLVHHRHGEHVRPNPSNRRWPEGPASPERRPTSQDAHTLLIEVAPCEKPG